MTYNIRFQLRGYDRTGFGSIVLHGKSGKQSRWDIYDPSLVGLLSPYKFGYRIIAYEDGLNARRDQITMGLMPLARQGDPVAIDRVLRMEMRRAALLGLAVIEETSPEDHSSSLTEVQYAKHRAKELFYARKMGKK